MAAAMNLNELLKSESNIQVVVSIADLKEFALAIVDEVSASDSRKKEDDQLISRKDAKKMLNVDYSTLWTWAKSGYLVPIKVGGKVFYKKSDVNRLTDGIQSSEIS
jgi:hypothetical protein